MRNGNAAARWSRRGRRFRSLRLSVRTPPFHGGESGSIPLGSASITKGCLLVLLCHKFLRGMFLCIGVAQHGHRDNLLARATLRRMRSVAIEFGTCRWVRSGGASGSVTVGNRKFLERPGGTRSTGGNRLPLGDQESVGGDAQRGVVVEAAP